MPVKDYINTTGLISLLLECSSQLYYPEDIQCFSTRILNRHSTSTKLGIIINISVYEFLAWFTFIMILILITIFSIVIREDVVQVPMRQLSIQVTIYKGKPLQVKVRSSTRSLCSHRTASDTFLRISIPKPLT